MLTVTLIAPADRRLREMLETGGQQVFVADADALSDIVRGAAATPDMVVFDVRGQAEVPAAVAALRRQHPTTGILLVASMLDPNLLLRAMRAGANEVVSEPFTGTDLEHAIARIVGRRPLPEPGRAFGFVGGKGGIGTTTIAVNVAAALGHAVLPERALLIDLHQAAADAALFLGADVRYSVADALENTHRLDQSFLKGLVASPTPELDLLAGPDRIVTSPVSSVKVRTLIDVAVTSYRFTVLDLPTSSGEVLDSLDRLDAIVVVTNKELPSVRAASRLMALLRERYERDKIMLVVSRSDRMTEISDEDIEHTIGAPIAHVFPSDYRLALRALNSGRPIVAFGRSELADAYKHFATHLTGGSLERAATRHGLFERLTHTVMG